MKKFLYRIFYPNTPFHTFSSEQNATYPTTITTIKGNRNQLWSPLWSYLCTETTSERGPRQLRMWLPAQFWIMSCPDTHTNGGPTQWDPTSVQSICQWSTTRTSGRLSPTAAYAMSTMGKPWDPPTVLWTRPRNCHHCLTQGQRTTRKRLPGQGRYLSARSGYALVKGITSLICVSNCWTNLSTCTRSLRNKVVTLPKKKGSALIAVNDWLSYYNVRLNQLEVAAGTEAVIMLKPTR